MARKDELCQKLKSGDESALDELVRLYYPDILRYCIRHTSSRQSAEDAAQDTFIKAVKHLDSYAHRGKFRAFLYKIAANTCTDLWRQNETQTLPESEEYIETGFARVEAEESLNKMLDALPGGQREVVILRYVHELKIREISDILNEPLRTVQSRLRAALKTLKKNLTKGEVNHE